MNRLRILLLFGCLQMCACTFEADCAEHDDRRSSTAVTQQEINRQRVVADVSSIQLGDSRFSVRNRLGKPSFESHVSRKENQEPIGWILQYDVVKCADGVAHDTCGEFVKFFFDNTDRLQTVESNIRDIGNR